MLGKSSNWQRNYHRRRGSLNRKSLSCGTGEQDVHEHPTARLQGQTEGIRLIPQILAEEAADGGEAFRHGWVCTLQCAERGFGSCRNSPCTHSVVAWFDHRPILKNLKEIEVIVINFETALNPRLRENSGQLPDKRQNVFGSAANSAIQ